MRVAAGGPLASLPAPGEGWLEVTGEVRQVGVRRLLVLPLAAPVGPSRGRRYRVAVGGDQPRPRVVLSVGNRAALVPPPRLQGRVAVRVQSLSRRASRHMPRDLVARLDAERLDLSVLADHEQQQLAVMLAEAHAGSVRAARLDAAVAAVRARQAREAP
jgi:hypothetical protein